MDKCIITCDPGLPGALAFWDIEQWEYAVSSIRKNPSIIPPSPLLGTFEFDGEKINTSYEDACGFALQCILSRLSGLSVVRFFYERPKVFSSYKSIAAAESGSISKLAFFTGRLHEFFNSNFSSKVFPVDVIKWKGSLPKGVVHSRVEQVFGEKLTLSSHEIDAIGIGLFILSRESRIEKWLTLRFH